MSDPKLELLLDGITVEDVAVLMNAGRSKDAEYCTIEVKSHDNSYSWLVNEVAKASIITASSKYFTLSLDRKICKLDITEGKKGKHFITIKMEGECKSIDESNMIIEARSAENDTNK